MQTLPYRLDESTGLIDYDALEATATLYRPKVLISHVICVMPLVCACISAGSRAR